MRPVWILALASLGCRSILGIEEPVTVTLDAPDFCAMWHPQGFDPCALGAPMVMPRLAGQYAYDTTTDGGTLFDSGRRAVVSSQLTMMQSDGSAVAVWSVDALAVEAGTTINVVGRKPLLVVAWSSATISGVLDAGSHIGVTNPPSHIAETVQFGAGANEACGTNVGGDGASALSGGFGGSGGGGGGGFRGAGGAGASGAGAGVTGGTGASIVPALTIRGGCPGGASGTAGDNAIPPATSSSIAQGGAGGGAIRLVAYDAITIAGSVGASGAGGAGAPLSSACGGGGGGSGGYIALEAPTVTIGANGTIAANGGGGGGGGGNSDAGNDGADGKLDVQAAPGGGTSNSGCGKAGGPGSAGTQLDGSNGPVPGGCSPGGVGKGGGGGAGGGGAGFIFITSPGYTAAATAKISPPALMP